MAKQQQDAGPPPAAVQKLLRAIPKVDDVLLWFDGSVAPAAQVKGAVREVLAARREAILAGRLAEAASLNREQLQPQIEARIAEKLRPNFRTVINATGVVIHTNLGRSLLPASAMETLLAVGTHYANLEFDLATGKRGSRYSLVEELLCELTGAEAALVVNNNAAAVMLVLETLAAGREVIVSRGQLVEIGGSFRIPEVMAKSGATLVEVGATNRTHLRDYERAITDQTALLLKVHTSNFRMIGFTKEVALADLVRLGGERGIPVMEDLGSGSFIDFSRYGLGKEPTVQETVAAGADVVTFSGDKMLGGPQAGLIVGKRAIIEQVKRNPMNRALRIDKFTLAALEAVLRLYFDEEAAVRTIPTLRMLTMPMADIERRAKKLSRRLGKTLAGRCALSLARISSRVGGGSLPEMELPSCGVALVPRQMRVNEVERRLRAASVPVIGRIENDCLLLDMRTVADDEIAPLAATLTEVLGKSKE
ncbi:MAG TPA: L-seryl-tRNA(Sec) selenium transferase [Desulfurivibrionaceae bacterium]|nr:L-seryl-tRNA(Sec) selenium transferase [Desulfurivibrionaceae bacterium]